MTDDELILDMLTAWDNCPGERLGHRARAMRAVLAVVRAAAPARAPVCPTCHGRFGHAGEPCPWAHREAAVPVGAPIEAQARCTANVMGVAGGECGAALLASGQCCMGHGLICTSCGIRGGHGPACSDATSSGTPARDFDDWWTQGRIDEWWRTGEQGGLDNIDSEHLAREAFAAGQATLVSPGAPAGVAGLLEALRSDGWSVAVHNDYRQDGKAMTFWLFTHADGRWIKGEGATDVEAIVAAWGALAVVPVPREGA